MSELVEFDDFAQVEMLLRAGMQLKYELSDDGNVLNGSPIYASALNHLRDGLVDGLRSSSTPGRAQRHADWYQLSLHQHHWRLIARRAARHPGWRDLTAVETRHWVETLAAPLAVDDAGLEAVKAIVDEMLDCD